MSFHTPDANDLYNSPFFNAHDPEAVSQRVAEYAAGVLAPAEAKDFEAFLGTRPDLGKEVQELLLFSHFTGKFLGERADSSLPIIEEDPKIGEIPQRALPRIRSGTENNAQPQSRTVGLFGRATPTLARLAAGFALVLGVGSLLWIMQRDTSAEKATFYARGDDTPQLSVDSLVQAYLAAEIGLPAGPEDRWKSRFEQGDYAGAARLLRNRPEALEQFYYGMSLIRLQQFDAAFEVLRRLKERPENFPAHGHLREELAWRLALAGILSQDKALRDYSYQLFATIEEENPARRSQARLIMENLRETRRYGEEVFILAGSLAPEGVGIEGGSFVMSTHNGGASGAEQPPHSVAVASFVVGAYEVTFDEYDRFCAATGRQKPDDAGWGRGERPVINVSWEDATAYAAWLSEQTGEPWQLPTEAEWEYAAGGGATQRANTRQELITELEKYAWYVQNSGNQTQFVGMKHPNPLGLYDVVGNVWEWCQNADGTQRVVRGGAWSSSTSQCRISRRMTHGADTRSPAIGFRLVRGE